MSCRWGVCGQLTVLLLRQWKAVPGQSLICQPSKSDVSRALVSRCRTTGSTHATQAVPVQIKLGLLWCLARRRAWRYVACLTLHPGPVHLGSCLQRLNDADSLHAALLCR
jgi:hypothetical protein